MCDADQLADKSLATGWVNRRQFAKFSAIAGAGGAMAACTPGSDAATDEEAAEGALVENPVVFDAPGGDFDGVFIHPAQGKYPAIIIWPDIAGLRPAKLAMGRRLAEAGFAVLVANPYYRNVSGQQFEDFDDWRGNDGFGKVRPWMGDNTPEAVAETAKAVVEWLDAQEAVDTSRGIGNQGYCMTGSWTIYASAAVPERVKVAASFHGGGLVGEAENAPVNQLANLAEDVSVLIAIARDDDAGAPTDKDALWAASETSNAQISIDVYDGDHGWTVLDSPSYAEAEAERGWAEMLKLYEAL